MKRKNLINSIRLLLLSTCVIIILFVTTILIYAYFPGIFENKKDNGSYTIYKLNYDTYKLSNNEKNNEIKYGFELFQNTPEYIGPNNKYNNKVYSGNNLSCTNCHLNAGTKAYSAPLIGVNNRFPQFRGRENKMGTLKERINGCMERSMNGVVLPVNGKEMNAMISYMKWISRYAPKDGIVKGSGFLPITIPNRSVNLEHGGEIYELHCVLCHEKDGSGQKIVDSDRYLYPPVWGDDAYNHGAGMTRVITAAKFIKANMPHGIEFNEPTLTDEECYDVAGYINQKIRPLKVNPEIDFPDIKKKPVSTPYPPFDDSFSIKQHQLGPFQPIMEYYKTKYGIVKTK